MQDNATQYAVNAYTFFQVKLFGSSWGGRLWYDLRQITRWDWVIWVVELLSCRPICSQSCIVMGCWDLSISFNISQLFFNIFLNFWARFFAKWTVQLSLKAQGMVVTSSHNHSHTHTKFQIFEWPSVPRNSVWSELIDFDQRSGRVSVSV